METFGVEFPFGSEPVEEIRLERAPLIRVVSQVRFPMIASIASPEFIAPFQERIRDRYPVLRSEHQLGIIVAEGSKQAGAEQLWRFADKPTDWDWRVCLGNSFVALECKRYSTRTEFIARLEDILRAIGRVVKPEVCDRVGVRYIDRGEADETVNSVTALFRPALLGMVGTPLGSDGATLHHSVIENGFRVGDNDQMIARWALLPPNSTTDPMMIEPVGSSSWILDVDMFSEQKLAFDASAITEKARSFSTSIYKFFRWATSKKFIEQYGGKP